MESITTVDLFAGAGGTSTGLVEAAGALSSRVNLTAINHNRKALETHQANFPWAKHILTELQFVDPSEVVPEGRLDGMVASPECTFFSRARGGKLPFGGVYEAGVAVYVLVMISLFIIGTESEKK